MKIPFHSPPSTSPNTFLMRSRNWSKYYYQSFRSRACMWMLWCHVIPAHHLQTLHLLWWSLLPIRHRHMNMTIIIFIITPPLFLLPGFVWPPSSPSLIVSLLRCHDHDVTTTKRKHYWASAALFFKLACMLCFMQLPSSTWMLFGKNKDRLLISSNGQNCHRVWNLKLRLFCAKKFDNVLMGGVKSSNGLGDWTLGRTTLLLFFITMLSCTTASYRTLTSLQPP